MRIKKILKRAAIIISVLLLVFKGFLMYRDYASYQGIIHEKADNIIKIQVDGIAQSLLFNAIKNPSFYLNNKSDKEDDKKEDKKEDVGYAIPANIFLYTIKGQPITTLFTSFKISDKDHFKNHLIKQYKIEDFIDSDNFTVAKNNDNTIVIAFNNKQCIVAYNPSKANVKNVFLDLLVNNKTLEKADIKWDKIKSANSHINYITKNDDLEINFKAGKTTISGNFVLPVFLDVPRTLKSTTFSSDASVTLDLNLFSTLKNMTFKHKGINVNTDSIDTYYNGHLALEVLKATTQIDSVVTYDYNDDFEKVATVSAVTKQVPEINLQLSSNASKLYKYLESISIIKQGKLNKDVFPLYQVKLDATSTNSLIASTNLSHSLENNIKETSEIFALNIDFEKLQQQDHFPMINSYLKKLTTLQISGDSSKDEAIAVDGQINLKNKDINALAQFFINQIE